MTRDQGKRNAASSRARTTLRGGAAAIALRTRLVRRLSHLRDRNQIWARLEQEARAGSGEAWVMLGILYEWWEDYRRALRHYERAAELGQRAAPWLLALHLEDGRHVRSNPKRAFEWRCFAAERGDVSAVFDAEQLAEEHGFELAPRRVTAWYRAAAERGDRDALSELAYRLHRGQGVRRDRRAAVALWRRAARLGDTSAWYFLGLAYELGHGVRASWPRALECHREAARRGDADACHALADYHARVEKDLSQHVRWLRMAASRGHAEAQCELGIRHLRGAGVRQDSRRAVRLYRQSAEQGYGWAMQLLGRCYKDGDGVRRDRRTARRWFERAVVAGKDETCPETVRVAERLLVELRKASGTR